MFPLPTASPSPSSVAPIPTVVPGNKPIYEVASDSGTKTLWVVFVLMLVASAGFTVMSWRVPLVRKPAASCLEPVNCSLTSSLTSPLIHV